MPIVICNKCSMKVLIKNDGSCPNCNSILIQTPQPILSARDAYFNIRQSNQEIDKSIQKTKFSGGITTLVLTIIVSFYSLMISTNVFRDTYKFMALEKQSQLKVSSKIYFKYPFMKSSIGLILITITSTIATILFTKAFGPNGWLAVGSLTRIFISICTVIITSLSVFAGLALCIYQIANLAPNKV